MIYNSNYSMEDYNSVMGLRKKGLGIRNIKRELEKINKNYITKSAIQKWIYKNSKPFQYSIIKKLKSGYENLTVEKAYLFGVLCGDGYLSTNNLIGLKVTDLDFVEEFYKCMKGVYGLENKIHISEGRITNMTNGKKGKTNYCWEKRSKLAHQDLLKYSDFKTETWIVPKEILKSNNLEIKSAFLRGLFDSEGTPRLKKKGNAYLQICSGNHSSLLKIKDVLKNEFSIELKIKYNQFGVMVLYAEDYKNIKLFSDMINFTILRKKIKLKKALESYKRKGLIRHSQESKDKALDLIAKGYSAYEVGKILKIQYTNIYDFIKQSKRKKY